MRPAWRSFLSTLCFIVSPSPKMPCQGRPGDPQKLGKSLDNSIQIVRPMRPLPLTKVNDFQPNGRSSTTLQCVRNGEAVICSRAADDSRGSRLDIAVLFVPLGVLQSA